MDTNHYAFIWTYNKNLWTNHSRQWCPFCDFAWTSFFRSCGMLGKTMWFVFLFANDLLSRTFLTLVEIIYAVSDPDMNVDKIVQTWFDGLWKNLIFLVDDWSTVGLYPKGNLDSENSLPCLIWHCLN